jgi:WD40-like Beta Propeller Repeat
MELSRLLPPDAAWLAAQDSSPTGSPNQAPVFTTPPFSIRRVSTPADGGAANGDGATLVLASGSIFSPNGRFFVFSSAADNLVAGDTNGRADVFVKDLLTGAIIRASTGSNGEQATSFGALPPSGAAFGSFEASFSPDGTNVIFSSFATNFASPDGPASTDIFIKNLVTGQLTRLTEGSVSGGTAGDNASFSPDGTKIAFWSTSSTLVSGYTNGIADVFVKDLVTGVATRVSTGSLGEQAASSGFGSQRRYPLFSRDGQKLLFESNAALLPGQTQLNRLYVKDLATGVLTIVAEESELNQRLWVPGATLVRRASRRFHHRYGAGGRRHQSANRCLCEGSRPRHGNARIDHARRMEHRVRQL